jgi:hypothetical protein
MTWYAHEIICQPTPELLAELRAHPVLSQGIYWVRDLDDFQWFRPEVQHRLPEGGLVFVRPLCAPYSRQFEWHGIDNPIDWFEVNPSASWQDLMMADREEPSQPPKDLRIFLRQLSYNTGTTVAFYQCEMWGGDIEFEKAWVYTPDETTYSHPTNDIEGFGSFPDDDYQPLIAMLKHFGLYLPTTYFALHTRSFPWARYKVPVP